MAQHGDVIILGRSGFAVLDGFIDVLNVRIQAPFSLRVKRVMERENITAYQAEDIVRQGDQVRAAFVNSFYGLKLNNAGAFDLLIDTAKIPPEFAVDWIVAVAKAPIVKHTLDDPTIAAIQVDPILDTAIANELIVLGSPRLANQ